MARVLSSSRDPFQSVWARPLLFFFFFFCRRLFTRSCIFVNGSDRVLVLVHSLVMSKSILLLFLLQQKKRGVHGQGLAWIHSCGKGPSVHVRLTAIAIRCQLACLALPLAGRAEQSPSPAVRSPDNSGQFSKAFELGMSQRATIPASTSFLTM